MKPAVDAHLKETLDNKLKELESKLDSDVVYFSGNISEGYIKFFRDFIEELKCDNVKRNKLCIFLRTFGGTAIAAEKMVNIVRFHYSEEVNFIILDYAMSAGTIFCMSGDNIYMDYYSCLGPIDPQVQVGDQLVPALGYLDKVNELIAKSANNVLTNAEFVLLQNQDLAKLRSYEQAKELSISLLKEWLVKYKFKNWTAHQSNPTKIGQPVTQDEKEERATQVAEILSDNNIWNSHGRHIGINKLRNILKLKIDDISDDLELYKLAREYNDLVGDYADKQFNGTFMHSRTFI
jgi:membrane-bound ClpP family serine protease